MERKKAIILVTAVFATLSIGLRGLLEGFSVRMLIAGSITTALFCVIFFKFLTKWPDKR